MKILQISNYFYPHLGGIEQVARDFANSVKNYKQKIICFNHEKGDKVDEIDGVQIIRAGCFLKIFSQSLSLSFGKLLKNTLKDFEPDVIIFHYPNPFAAFYLLKLLKKYKNCKLVLYWHLDITKQKILKRLFYGQTVKLLKRAKKVIATSPNYIKGSKFLTEYSYKCVVIPNCVAQNKINLTDEIISRGEEIKSNCKNKIICFAVGRHVPYKGIQHLVQASKFLPQNVKIFIGGNGELTKSLIKMAEEDKKIEFLGRLSEDDLKAYYYAADIFCFPSVTKNEAFGLALAEAMAHAKPCVTFTIQGSGVNYVSLNGVTGIEVENKNEKQFANAIKILSKNQTLRKEYGLAAKKRVEELFTFSQFFKNVQNLLNNL